MTTRFGRALCCLVLPWVVAGACHDVGRHVGETCASDRDCREPYVCVLGACRAECEMDRDCNGGACLVIDNQTRVCTLADERGCEADLSSACPSGFECGVDGECRNACNSREPCPADRRCVEGACFDPAAGGAGDGGATGGGATSATGDGATSATGGGATSATGGGGAKGDGGAPVDLNAAGSGSKADGGDSGTGGDGGTGGAADGSGPCDAASVLGDGGNSGAPQLASVDYVSPYVAYEGDAQRVVIRGQHFPKTATVCFGKWPAASVEVTSSTEIRAVPPLPIPRGHFNVTLGREVALTHANAELVVRAHPDYAYTSLPTDVGFQDRHVLYDAERDAVFSYCSWFGDYSSTNPSTINRYAYDEQLGEWAATSGYVPDLWDIDMSPDGRYLVALSTSRLWLLDPVTLGSRGYVDLPSAAFGTARQLGVANDGKVLIRDLGKAYSLVQKTFSPAQFPAGIGIVFSADGSVAVVGDANTSNDVPLSIYDAGTGRITPSKAYEYFQLPSLDRTGSRYFAGGHLRDAALALIGGIPTYMGYMRPDGKRAYEIDGNDRRRIHAYDLAGNGPSFPQLADVVVADPIDAYWLNASLDSRFIVAPGPQTFKVIPLP